RIYVCPPGAPMWRTLGRQPNVPSDGCILFVGTLEPRKNVGALLDAYQQLLDGGRQVPRMVLAGRATAAASNWLARINSTPLSDHVRHIGYVDDQAREDLYRSARVLVLPSLAEGFRLPAPEALSPVVRGWGAQGEPADRDALMAAIERAAFDQSWALRAAQAGLDRARSFTWTESARTLHRAYAEAVARRRD